MNLVLFIFCSILYLWITAAFEAFSSLTGGRILKVAERDRKFAEQLEEWHDREESLRALEEAMAREGADLDDLGEKYQKAQDRFELLGGYGWESRLQGVLKGLGLTEDKWEQPVSLLSGGEKTRLALARLLLDQNDILLLDEPTNHLDIDASQWLTDFLARFAGTVLLISHDRYMMDKLCAGVAQIENGRLHFYRGNYTDYCRKWEEECRAQEKRYNKQQDEIKRQRAIIARYRSFNREKSIRAAESREKALARMDLVDAPETHEELRLRFDAARPSGGDVLNIKNITKRYGDRTLFAPFSASVRQGQRIAILGANGTGKTTLLDILRGALVPDGGAVTRGVNVDIGYYEQTHRDFMGRENVMDMVWAGNRDLTQTQVRSRCAAMLFFGEDVFKEGRVLSGGERARCALAWLSVSGANTLFLDEPTNHLDMDSREVLEDALERFEGTILAVSHDRYFINRLFDTLWIVRDGTVTEFEGSYDEFLQAERGSAEDTAPVNKTQLARARAKERDAREKEKKRKQSLRDKEAQIEQAEREKAELEAYFADPAHYADGETMQKQQEVYRAVCAKIDRLTEEWMEESE